MTLSEEAMAEFKSIYETEFREALSEDEAKEIAFRMLNLIQILLAPDDTPQSPAR
jgi:hypothetical protein